MAWTALGVAGILCLIVAAYLLAGVAGALILAGLACIAAAVDGRRA
jgi:hypothetical protein